MELGKGEGIMSKLMQAAKKSFLILCQIWKVFEKENLFLRASSLTLTSLLNLVPLMVVIFWNNKELKCKESWANGVGKR